MDDRLPDVLLAEFSTLRDEIAAHDSEKSRNLALTLTATAAIGTFALRTDGNREVLLVLPLVLAGLAISFTNTRLTSISWASICASVGGPTREPPSMDSTCQRPSPRMGSSQYSQSDGKTGFKIAERRQDG
jgi:hypothetical protein